MALTLCVKFEEISWRLEEMAIIKKKKKTPSDKLRAFRVPSLHKHGVDALRQM